MNFGSFEMGIFGGILNLLSCFIAIKEKNSNILSEQFLWNHFILGKFPDRNALFCLYSTCCLVLVLCRLYHEISKPWLYLMHNVHVCLWSWSYWPPGRCIICAFIAHERNWGAVKCDYKCLYLCLRHEYSC